ncbi:hypothetical protein [Chitinophaga rhizophila]|uniref:Uncharacterized protein n=1 Tax=Chitinophaga rhizophila TaxID=2866212 RepID=A0ABS7G7B1_9BACT|nr:hypothetical protein [Chitinophaga rhizophila]MBW8683529.1 hypothetical protein [Chitinophaga rhizophila]
MPTKETPLNPPRNHVAAPLAQKFQHDYEAIMEHYTVLQQLEISEHLLSLVQLARQEGVHSDQFWYQYKAKDLALLKRYGKTLRPYVSKCFYAYFYYDTVLAQKEIYSSEIFNSLTGAEQFLSADEISQFLQLCQNMLEWAINFLYLQKEPEGLDVETVTAPATEEPDKEATRYRQLLTLYYLLKAGFQTEHRDNGNISDVVRLAHLLTGVKFTSLQNSDIYKKYAKIPDHKAGTQLLADLQYIRPYFTDLHLDSAVALIDEDIRQHEKRIRK